MVSKFKSDPTKMFIKMNGYLRTVVREEWEISVLKYQEERETYVATLEAVKALNIKYVPTIYSYKANDIGSKLNSCALGYGNNINIFLSYYLFNQILSDIKEKEFIVGHELGHNQSNHTGVHILGIREDGETSRYGEYTADRAGLLACKDLEAAVRSLLKVSTIDKISNEKFAETAKSMVENAQQNLIKLSGDHGTHPCLERRVAAMKEFYSSQMYARITGDSSHKNPISDIELEERLKRIIKGGN